MSQAEFSERLDNMFNYFYERGGTAVIGSAPVDTDVLVGNPPSGNLKPAPVCLTLIDFSQEAFFPHVIWFQWSTPRNRIESTVNFLKDLIKDGNVLIFSRKETVFFFSHMARYGLLTRRGLLKKYFPDGSDATIYQGVK